MATWTNFSLPFFADKALEGLVNTLVPLRAFSFSATNEPVQRGKTALVPLIGAVTATTFANSYAICGGSASVITVTINRHRIASIGQDDLTAADASKGMLSDFAYQQGAGLAVAVLQDIWSLLTTANFANITSISSTALGIAELRAGRKALSKNKVPVSPRAFVFDSDPYDTLLGISNFIQVNLSGSNETLREGRISRALGADIYETNALPGTNSVMGFIAHPSAVAVAMRYLDPGETGRQYYMEARPVTDPETGITYGIRHHYDPNTGTEYVNLECNYGYVAALTNCARLYTRTD